MTRDVAIIGFAQQVNRREHAAVNDVEILIDPVDRALDAAGVRRDEVQLTTGGSNDFLVGQAFSFVRALDAVGVHPCKEDSHVEMDAAWAVYEAWVQMQLGDVDCALVYGLGKAAMGDIAKLMTLSLDPYYMAPLYPTPAILAALQARALIDAGRCTERELAAIAAERQAGAVANPWVEWDRARTADEILDEPYHAPPLRPSMSSPVTDGAAVIVLAAGELARARCPRPAWIRGIDHRTDAHAIGVRAPTDAPSARLAAHRAGLAARPVDVVELHAAHAHEEIVLRDALGLAPGVRVNPSGGALTADPVMATGLIRIGEAASRVIAGDASRVAAHATAGPWLQSNLVVVMEAAS